MLFRKEGDDDKWLRYATKGGHNFWIVSPTTSKDANDANGWAKCVEKGLHDPAEAATWTVGDGQKFTVQPAITCVRR